jgi:anti-anti-sigma factor
LPTQPPKKPCWSDPVIEQVDRDVKWLQELGLTLEFCLETHIHADHITGTSKLRELTSCEGIVPEHAQLVALALHLWQTSHPHIVIVGRLGDSEHFRNVLRYDVKTSPEVLAVRVDASLYFANAKYLESFLTQAIADQSEIKSILLVCSAINLIDASALEILESLIADFRNLGIQFYFAEVKGPVMDKLNKIGFVEYVGRDRFFLSTDIAMQELAGI